MSLSKNLQSPNTKKKKKKKKIRLFIINRSLNVKKLSKLFNNERLSLDTLERLGFKRQNNRLIMEYQSLDQPIHKAEENYNLNNSDNRNCNVNATNHCSNGDKNDMKSNGGSIDDVDVVTKSPKVQNNPAVVAMEFKKSLDEAMKSNNAFQLNQWIEKQQIQVC